MKNLSTAENPIVVPYFKPLTVEREKYYELLDEVFDSAIFTNNGPKALSLEKEIARIHEFKYCAVVTNATIGLQILYKTLNLKKRVITTPFSFVATTSTLVWESIQPKFVDIEERNLTIDSKKIEKSIDNSTEAILGVNVFGNSCDYDAISYICKKNDIFEIYDNAHSFGIVDSKGFDRSSVQVLSFHSTKVFSTIEGGAILTNNRALYEKIVQVRNFGFAGMDHVTEVGTNGKMDEFRASFGLHQLLFFYKVKERLREINRYYTSEISKIPCIEFVGNSNYNSNHHYYPIRINEKKNGVNRDLIWAYLWSQGIQTRRYFYPLISKFSPYREFFEETPIAAQASEEILCLPCYFDLSDDSARKVVAGIQKAISIGATAIEEAVKSKENEDFFRPVKIAFQERSKNGY
ncbi:MAG: DegT/DnrJ/EryC1/StrS family aminotransferase [Bdellovibrionaceae bacterium]|nr:DegT/DnrJ/EryC1/StrS family aminotransferase [Pseudobdellovibrionaceae bacterium]